MLQQQQETHWEIESWSIHERSKMDVKRNEMYLKRMEREIAEHIENSEPSLDERKILVWIILDHFMKFIFHWLFWFVYVFESYIGMKEILFIFFQPKVNLHQFRSYLNFLDVNLNEFRSY